MDRPIEVQYDLHRNEIQRYALTVPDRRILTVMRTLLPGIALVFGPSCMVSLHSAAEPHFACIAVENGHINNISIGSPVSEFVEDILTDEAHHGGKNTVGIYYAKTADDHAIKSVINLIRNENQDLIGCMCICIDVSVPLHKFMRNFIPVVDKDLANSISDPIGNAIENVNDMIHISLEQALTTANGINSDSATERNKFVVKTLQNSGIFNIRSAVSIVAKELGVSRYTIYNYLKDN